MSCCDNPRRTSSKSNRRSRFANKEMTDPITKEKYTGYVHDGYDVTITEYCDNYLTVYGSHDEKESQSEGASFLASVT